MEVRYLLEHKFLPQVLFSAQGKKTVILLMNEHGSVLVRMMELLGSKLDPHYRCPYRAEDYRFSGRVYGGEDGTAKSYVLRIDMPAPESPPLCHAVYICHDENCAHICYYTLEESLDGARCLCGWSPDGCHINYGPAGEGPDELTVRVSGLYAARRRQKLH